MNQYLTTLKDVLDNGDVRQVAREWTPALCLGALCGLTCRADFPLSRQKKCLLKL